MNRKIDKKQVADLYHSGMNMRQIGKALGVSNADICKFMIKHNVSTRCFGSNRPQAKIKRVDVQEITDLYKSGEKVAEIAKMFDVTASTVLHFMRRHGIRLKQRVKLDKKEVADLYNSGKSSAKIAKILGVSIPTICNFMKKHGIKFRKDR